MNLFNNTEPFVVCALDAEYGQGGAHPHIHIPVIPQGNLGKGDTWFAIAGTPKAFEENVYSKTDEIPLTHYAVKMKALDMFALGLNMIEHAKLTMTKDQKQDAVNLMAEAHTKALVGILNMVNSRPEAIGNANYAHRH